MRRPGSEKRPKRKTGSRDHRKNIACLESLWNSNLENRLSVVPILELVSRVNGVRYTYLTCNTREELRHNLGKLERKRRYGILYLSFHGRPGEVVLDGTSVDLETLATLMARGFAGWVVHFGTCATIDIPRARMRKFMNATAVAMVLGYGTHVNWVASAALDLLLFDWLQYYGDMRRLWKGFGKDHAGLIANTGLRAFHA